MFARRTSGVRAVLLLAFASLGCSADLDAYASGSVVVSVNDTGVVVSLEANGLRCPTLSTDVRVTFNGKPMKRTDRGGEQSCHFNSASVHCTGAHFELAWPDAKKEKAIHVELVDGKRSIVIDASHEPQPRDMVEVVSPKTPVGMSPATEIRVRIRPGLGRWAPGIGSPTFGKKDPKDGDDHESLHFEQTSDTEGVFRLLDANQKGAKVVAISKARGSHIVFPYQVDPVLRCEGVRYCHAGVAMEGTLDVPASFE